MNKERIRDLALKIWKLEQECQSGINVSENVNTMDKIANDLTLSDLLEISAYIEDNFQV